MFFIFFIDYRFSIYLLIEGENFDIFFLLGRLPYLENDTIFIKIYRFASKLTLMSSLSSSLLLLAFTLSVSDAVSLPFYLYVHVRCMPSVSSSSFALPCLTCSVMNHLDVCRCNR